MSTHNTCFCEEIRKISILFAEQIALFIAMMYHFFHDLYHNSSNHYTII